MESFALNGLFLVGALLAAYAAGVFTSQYVKDKIAGVPGTLRSALKTAESDAKARLASAQAKVVADVAGLVAPKAQAAAAAVAAAAKPAAPAAPAAPAPVAPAASA